MPAPSVENTKTAIAVPYTVEGGFSTSIDIDSNFCVKFSNGFVNGWTCASPTTASSFETQIISAFGSYITGGSNGLLWITCIGRELDNEVIEWVDSWNSSIHTYTPSSSAIVTRIEGCQPFSSNATTKMNQTIADWFITNFGQETA